MVAKITNLKVLLAILVSVAMLAAVACAADEPAAVVVPSPVPASEIAAMVTDAVKAASTDPADIMKAVDSAVMAMPAPKVDAAEIEGLVAKAVAASVPEGVNAAQIENLVKAAVTAATSGVPTKGELEASIRNSVTAATAGQLTATEVQAIVAASVDAMAAKVQSQAGFRLISLPVSSGPVNMYPNVALDADQVLRMPYQYQHKGVEPWKGEHDAFEVAWQPLTVNMNNEIEQRVAMGYSQNADSTVFRLHFNPDAVFADGTPFTAMAAKASLEFGSAPENQAVWGGLIDRIDRVVGMKEVGAGDRAEADGLIVIDDHTLEMRLVGPTAHFPWLMTDRLWGFGNIAAIEKDPTNFQLHTPGIGPFQFTINPDDGHIVMTPSDHFWEERPTLAGIDRQGIPDQQTRFIMYENAEVDIGPNFAVKDDPSHSLFGEVTYQNNGGLGWFFAFHLDKPPFEDKNVRAAMVHAIDMIPIVEGVFNETTATGIINGAMNCIDPEKLPYPGTGENPWSGVYRYDPEYARQLLAESTYGSASNLPPIVVWLRRDDQTQVGVLMQEALRDNLGVEMSIVRFERGQTIPPESNIKRRSRGTGFPDPAVLMRDMAHSSSGLIRDLGWHQSPAGPVIDKLVEEALALPLDDPRRCDAFIQAERLATADYRYMPNRGIQASGPNRLIAPWVLGFQSGAWRGAFIGTAYWQIGERDRSLYPNHEWGRGPAGN